MVHLLLEFESRLSFGSHLLEMVSEHKVPWHLFKKQARNGLLEELFVTVLKDCKHAGFRAFDVEGSKLPIGLV